MGEEPDCRQAMEFMYHFLDGEIDGVEKAHVKEHLDECLPCLEAFEFEAELKAVIASKCRDEMPSELFTKVKMKLVAEIAEKEISERNSPPGI